MKILNEILVDALARKNVADWPRQIADMIVQRALEACVGNVEEHRDGSTILLRLGMDDTIYFDGSDWGHYSGAW